MSNYDTIGVWMQTWVMMHEQLVYSKVSKDPYLPHIVSEYCQLLLKFADECSPEVMGIEGVSVNLTLQLKGRKPASSSENMGKFLETLWLLTSNPRPFTFDCKCSGRLAEKNWITDKNGEQHRLRLPRKMIPGGLRNHIESKDEKYTYKQVVRYGDSGEWNFVKTENDKETAYDQVLFEGREAFGTSGWENPSKKYFAPLTTSSCSEWVEEGTCMWVLVDEEKHPGVMEQLYAIMAKHLPAQAAVSAKEEREWDTPNDRKILCAGSYLNPQDILELQPLLDELNEVLLPIKEDIVDVATQGYWVNMDDFRIATWVWTEEGFQIWSMTY